MRFTICQIIIFLVISVALLVTAGHVADITELKTVIPNAVTMKFTTSISFVFSSLIVLGFLHLRNKVDDSTKYVEPSVALIALVLSQIIFLSVMLGDSPEITSMFTHDDEEIYSTSPGVPSLGTLLGFTLIMLIGIGSVFHSKSIFMNLKWIGMMVMIIGLLGLAGYAFDIPKFYYYVEDLSTAMAIHTSLLFAMTGLSVIIPFCIRKKF